MNISLFLARRLSLSSGGKKSSPAVKVAIAAVALSVIVMMSAIAIVMGFKDEITRKVAGFNSQISLFANPMAEEADLPDSNLITLTQGLRKVLDDSPFIEDYAMQVSIPSILKTSSDFKGVYLKSLSGKEIYEFINSSLIEGEIPDYSQDSCKNLVVVSKLVASRLGLKLGDRIDSYFITDRILARPMKIAAIFDSHFEAYDDAFAYGALQLVQELGNLSANQATSVAISVKDFADVSENADALQQRLISDYTNGVLYRLYRVETALQSGAAYFQWLSLLDMNVIVVLTLMTIVACVTLVSGMLILMVDKIRFIALLTALGASRKRISRVFILLAAKIAAIGLIIGDILSLAFLYFQDRTHLLPLDPESYYIDFVPVKISLWALLLLNIGVLLIMWIVLILPSRFAGKAAPASTLAAE